MKRLAVKFKKTHPLKGKINCVFNADKLSAALEVFHFLNQENFYIIIDSCAEH